MNWRRLPGAIGYILVGAVTGVARNLSLAALALVLALSLWLFVTDRENPNEVEAFNRAIPLDFVNVPDDLAVANTSATSVRIRIEAPRNDLDDLDADDFEATVNLGGVERGEHRLSVDVTASSGRISVVEVSPSVIDITIEGVRSKEVPVVVQPFGSPQAGFAVTQQRVEPERVTVSGPESLVELVDSAVAEVSLTGQRVDLAEERVPLEPRDARGGGISRVAANPATAAVTIELEQREFSLQFTVAAAVTGAPASGYNVAAVSVEPRLVLLRGSLDVLQSIDPLRGLRTEEISVSDARDDVSRTVNVVVPEGARIDGSPSVNVLVDINPAQGEFTFRVAPQVRNLGDGLAVAQAEAVTVTLAGDVPVLQSLTAESIAVAVDAQGLGAGLHALPLEVTPPPGTNVIRTEPGLLGVALIPRS
jgi:YbbR domain-containing protein